MPVRMNPADTDVPFFPFRLKAARENHHYTTSNHLLDKPVRLNQDAAELLRLANGETAVAAIVDKLVDRYPDAGGPEMVRPHVLTLLNKMAAHELVWWREVPAEPIPAGPPQLIFWEITAACNLRCRHCVVAAGAKVEGELRTERCLELAREMADFGVESIAFSGGEPLVHSDFQLIAEYTHDLGMAVQVATNGTLITPDMARWLKEIGAGVQVSLDGSTAEIHDYMRPGVKTYHDTIQGIKNLVALGVPVTIGTVLTKRNLGDIPAMLDLAQSLGADAFRLIPFVPKGRGAFNKALEVSAVEAREVTSYLCQMRERKRLRITKLEFEDMLDGRPCPAPLTGSRKLGCDGAVGYATITPIGELLPCHFFEGVRADSVVKEPFEKVWRCSRFLNYFRHLTTADLHGACSDCSWLASCGGSCRAVNFAKGDVFGANYGCWLAES